MSGDFYYRGFSDFNTATVKEQMDLRNLQLDQLRYSLPPSFYAVKRRFIPAWMFRLALKYRRNPFGLIYRTYPS